jgi:HAD superfamily hydrolase (TIGR01484 family)
LLQGIAMRYHALAADYDGTLAHHGLVEDATVAALERLAATGRRLILVTGRELDELLGVFPRIGVFDLVVAENGGLLYWPATREVELLCKAPPEAFVGMLRGRGVDPLAVGRSIVATVHPNETTVLETIRDLGLELHVIFNKGAVMVLPTGVNKASGLAVALERLGLSPHNVAAVGDAENDHSMLQYVEYGAATANAVPMLKENADRTLSRGHGAGVMELVEDLVANDLGSRPPQRRRVLLGHAADGTPFLLPAASPNLLVAGVSGSGKSSLASGVAERLAAQGYQCCIIDPEGDYAAVGDAIVLGGPEAAPSDTELATALDKPDANVVLDLRGVPRDARPEAFTRFWSQLDALRPHCIVVGEAHALLPPEGAALAAYARNHPSGVVLVTAHPEALAPAVLQTMGWVAATGRGAGDALHAFAASAGVSPPETPPGALAPGEALVWNPRFPFAPLRVRVEPPSIERRRERRREAAGELPPDRSFWFRGPEGRLNLRAQNLALFVQIAEGLDDDTWNFHLWRGDYSEWLLNSVRDPELAQAVRLVEKERDAAAAASRARVREAVEARHASASVTTS